MVDMTPAPSPYLSIVIPAYNEEFRILPTLEKVEAFIRAQAYPVEVIIVDDCSKDKTHAVVDQFINGKPQFMLVRNNANLGKGGSVKNGMLSARGDFLLFSDADLSTPIEEANRLLGYCSGPDSFDVVMGSRRVKGARLDKRQPFLRELSGRIFSLVVRSITIGGFLDTQCGFKLFKRQAAQEIFRRQTILGFGFDVELIYIAVKKLNLRVKEAPVRWMDSRPTKVRLLRDPFFMLMDLFRIRWNDGRGLYR